MLKRRLTAGILVAILLGGCGGSSRDGNFNPPPPPPPPPPAGLPDVVLQPVFPALPSFSQPVALLQVPGDGSRWYVLQKNGVVLSFDNDPAVSNPSLVLDLSAVVNSSGEGGLLGMAFHPDVASNGEVYLSYTRTGGPLESVVSRFGFDAAANTIDPNSEEILLTLAQPAANHNGGHVAFGPDGYLYVGFGDGGGAGDPFENGQDTTNIFGTIVRIDVDGVAPYEIPADNPFAGQTECFAGIGTMDCPEIYAWGLRNPWRFSFDRLSGELWVGDVGQDAWEEIDRVELGLNYGWDEREGAHCFEPPSGCSTANVDPITEYGHNVGRSVTGGYVYRGSAIPDLQGYYVFGDFISGRVWAIDATSGQGTVPEELLISPYSIVTFAEGEDGELYVVDFGGRAYRVVAAP